MKGHLREKRQRETAKNWDAELEREPEEPSAPKKRKRGGLSEEEEKREKIRDIKRWKNQIFMKMNAKKKSLLLHS